MYLFPGGVCGRVCYGVHGEVWGRLCGDCLHLPLVGRTQVARLAWQALAWALMNGSSVYAYIYGMLSWEWDPEPLHARQALNDWARQSVLACGLIHTPWSLSVWFVKHPCGTSSCGAVLPWETLYPVSISNGILPNSLPCVFLSADRGSSGAPVLDLYSWCRLRLFFTSRPCHPSALLRISWYIFTCLISVCLLLWPSFNSPDFL